MNVQIEKIPAELKQRVQWVVWRSEKREGTKKLAKVPVQALSGRMASTDDPTTWCSFSDALKAYRNGVLQYTGIGFVFSNQDPFAGIDLDGCIDGDGEVSPEASAIVKRLGSYTELSPSGRGLHIIVKATLPDGGRRIGQIELYDSGRYFTVTGNHFDGTPTSIECRQHEIEGLHAELFGHQKPSTRGKRAHQPNFDGQVSDEELIEYAKAASNGDKFSALYSGDVSEYQSQSEADLALCMILAFWAGRDVDRVDRLFRRSVLMREKWDEPHYAGGQSYGEHTIEKALERQQHYHSALEVNHNASQAPGSEPPDQWPEPQPIPKSIPPVDEFDIGLLPSTMRGWIEDATERMQSPIDYGAITAMVMLASLIGRKVAIRPKSLDDWSVVPNLWGLIVGRPSQKKTPAVEEVLRPMRRLDAACYEVYAREMEHYKAKQAVAQATRSELQKQVREAKKAGKPEDEITAMVRAEEAVEPTRKRFIVNDATIEKLGEILKENQNGLLLFRDEFAGFLAVLEKPGREGDRKFYLESWTGHGSYTMDRIGRGTVHVPHVCLSILGTIQPGALSQYLRSALKGGIGDDGLMQRFQLAVWPDSLREYRHVDRRPDEVARELAFKVVDRLERMTSKDAGAKEDEFADIPYLHIAPSAQPVFDEWLIDLENRLRSGEEHPALESHLAKYRSLVPSIALILHLAEERYEFEIQREDVERAIRWAAYLESHARRIYVPVFAPEYESARMLTRHIQQHDLPDGFTVRNVYRKGWAGLSDQRSVEAAIGVLADLGWLKEKRQVGRSSGGRPSYVYLINPGIGEL